MLTAKDAAKIAGERNVDLERILGLIKESAEEMRTGLHKLAGGKWLPALYQNKLTLCPKRNSLRQAAQHLRRRCEHGKKSLNGYSLPAKSACGFWWSGMIACRKNARM